jgi:hypothetical protein
MKRTAFILVLILLGVPAFAAENGQMSGVWRIVKKTDLETVVYHLSIGPGQEFRCYDSFWNQVPLSEATVSGEEISFNMLAGGQRFQYKGGGPGKSWTGHWRFFHVQYPMSGEFQAHKIFDSLLWEPFASVGEFEVQNGVYDLSGYLLRTCDLSSEDAFLRDWNLQREIEVYPLVHQALYGDGYFSDPDRERRLKQLYQTLTSASFRRNSTDFLVQTRRVITDIRKKLPTIQLDPQVVSSPFKGFDVLSLFIHAEDCNCPMKKARVTRPYQLFSVPEVYAQYSDSQLPYFLANKMIKGQFTARPKMPSLHLDLFHAGTASYLASLLGYSEDRADYLFLGEDHLKRTEEDLEKWKKEMLLLTVRPNTEKEAALFSAAPKPAILVGYEFAKKLAEVVQPEQYFTLNNPTIMIQLQSFLHNGELALLEKEQPKADGAKPDTP